ncbi:MAG: hypothetical protein V1899_12210 [Planctomycetota bacterium]
MRRRAVILVVGLILAAAAQAGSSVSAVPENAYIWKAGDVFRFEYFKSITVKQPDETGRLAERVTEVAGVLILEIRQVAASGATATLRLDSPRITLPESVQFSAQSDEPQLQPMKNRSVAHALEGAIKTARWNCKLSSNGLIYVESRTPKDMAEWLKDIETAATWRKKFLDVLPRIIEQDLGLKTPSHDRDSLLYLGSAPPVSTTRAADHLRPRREALTVVSNDGEKATLNFKRVAPKDAGVYQIPDLLKNETISASLVSVSIQIGRAVFDLKIGMLDTLNEKYTASLKYTYQAQLTLDQEVCVEYRLKRLAPPISAP